MDNHIPVMLEQSLTSLDVKSNGTYVDLTLGRGGHAAAILKHLTTGTLIAFDKDKQALHESKARLLKIGKNFRLIHADNRNLKQELSKLNLHAVDGIIADLGVSSPQLDQAERGFSYRLDARLDMRMDQSQKLDAYQIVNTWTEQQLVNIFRNFADVKLPQRVAKGIISHRPITNTLELVKLLRTILPAPLVRKKNPAKAVFQALRIAVNQELDALSQVLTDAMQLLKINGTLAIITFHSLEDKIVKKFFQKLTFDNTGKLPIIVKPQFKTKTYKPTTQEIASNKRSRSAKLRTITKLRDRSWNETLL